MGMKFLLILPALILSACAGRIHTVKSVDDQLHSRGVCPAQVEKICGEAFVNSSDLKAHNKELAKRIFDLEMENAALRSANEFILGRSKPIQPRDQKGRFIKGVDTVK